MNAGRMTHVRCAQGMVAALSHKFRSHPIDTRRSRVDQRRQAARRTRRHFSDNEARFFARVNTFLTTFREDGSPTGIIPPALPRRHEMPKHLFFLRLIIVIIEVKVKIIVKKR